MKVQLSKEFWISVATEVLAIMLYFVVKYLSPSTADDVAFVVTHLQPIILALIGAFALRNIANVYYALRELELGLKAREQLRKPGARIH